MPRAFVFDAYGTLFDVHSVQARCEAFWPARGAALSQLWRAKQLEYTWQRSLMGRYEPFSHITREALEYACAALGLALDGARAHALLDEYRRLALFPEVREALARLGSQPRAILTNGSPDMIEPLVAHSGLAFDAVITAHELAIYKPAPQVYRLALERLGVAAADIVFVSSNCWDALGAKAFGLHAVWVNRAGAPADRLGVAPDRIVTSLAGL
jgi:2-haloacid dehalogenase